MLGGVKLKIKKVEVDGKEFDVKFKYKEAGEYYWEATVSSMEHGVFFTKEHKDKQILLDIVELMIGQELHKQTDNFLNKSQSE